MKKKHPLYMSFGFAFKGLIIVLKERNFKIQLLCALIAIILGLIYNISSLEWIGICFCIGLVLCLEITNTAIEKNIDLLHPEWNEKAGMIKDLSAGAVLIASISSAVVAGIIFLPKILLKCNGG